MIFIRLTVVLLILILFTGCEKHSTDPGNNTVDIVFTDAEGNINGDDDINDWQPRAIAPDFHFGPAYPDPVTGTAVTIPYSVPTSPAQVELVITNKEMITDTLIILINSGQNAGYYQILWNLNNSENILLPDGLYRAHIQVNCSDTTYRSFGDIKIE